MGTSTRLQAVGGGDLARFAASVGPTAGGVGLQLLVFAMTARALGPDAFGQLAAVYAVSVIATEITGLGGDAAMVRETATDSARFGSAWGQALLLFALSAPVAGTLAGIAAASLAGITLPVAAALVFGEIVVGRSTAATELALVAHADPVRASFVRPMASAARAAAALLLFGILGVHDLAAWAVATIVQSGLVAAALLMLVRRRYGPAVFRVDGGLLRFGLLLMLNQLARVLNGTLDRVVLAALMSPAALGLYAAASRVQLLGAVIIQAATRIVHPRFFAAAAAGEAELGALTRRAAAQMAFVGGAGMMLVALAAQILPLVLGESFAGAGALGTLLSAAVPCLALQYPAADALTARNRQGLRTVLHLVAAAACVGLVALGAVLAGIPGAAHGYVAGQALLAATLWGALGLVSRRTA